MHQFVHFTSRCSLGLLLAAVSVTAQAHSAPQAVPAGARSLVCAGQAVPQFADVTAKAGIHFKHLAAPQKKYIVESMSGGVIVIDYDRDGWPDLYFTNAPTVEMAIRGEKAAGALFHNNGDGTFTDVTAKSGLAAPGYAMGGAVGDFDNDGWPDLYITCLGGNALFHNNGDGTFTDVTAKAGVGDGRWSTGAAFADYDGDGLIDLAVSNYVDFHLDDLPGFGSSPTCRYRGIDVQCGPRGLRGAGDSLFHNNGNGTFTDVSKTSGTGDKPGYYGLGMVWSDLTGSGRQDLYVADDSTPNYLYRNDGNGHFTDIGLESGTAVSGDGSEQGSMGVAIGDYDHSGRFSIYVTNFENEFNTLYQNTGKGEFNDVSYDAGVALPSLPYVKWGTVFTDIDNDGWLDLVSVNGHVYPQVDTLPSGARYAEPANVLLNQRNGTFCDAGAQVGAALHQPHVGRGLAALDFDNDGSVDLVVENLDGAPMLLRNPGVPGRHWISFELAGTKSNRLALGARMVVHAGSLTQSDEVRSGGSYLSQSDLRLHFGLAGNVKVDSVEVHWPSGAVETLHDLPADKFYAVQEGRGIVPMQQIRPTLKR